MSDITRTVLRWEVPVDGEIHKVGGGRVLLVACRNRLGMVEVWTEELARDWPRTPVEPTREVQVFGTGDPVPMINWRHLGSTLDGALYVWHVFEQVRLG